MRPQLKEIVVISGKGGTGKTSLTAALAALTRNAVLADCDVEAPDLHLLLNPDIQQTEPFHGSKVARVVEELCDGCGQCIGACRFEALSPRNANTAAGWAARVDELLCEGCGLCAEICPTAAIQMHPRVTGEKHRSRTRFGPMVHARLRAGQGNSGKLVTAIRRDARDWAAENAKDLILSDGPPGIGCPVIASLGGADLAVIVTEPTVSGLHDMQRVAELAAHFEVPAVLCINRYDLEPDQARTIEQAARRLDVAIVGRIPYDESVTAAMLAQQTIIEHAPDSPAGRAARSLHAAVMRRLDDLTPRRDARTTAAPEHATSTTDTPQRSHTQ